MSFLGLAVFIAHLELLYILRYNVSICTLTQTLMRAGWELFSMAVVAGVVFLAFLTTMTLLFGSTLADYASLTQTCTTLARAALNNFDHMPVLQNYGPLGCFFLLSYLLFTSIMAMNFFITLLNIFFEQTSNDPQTAKLEGEVMNHLEKTVKKLILSKGK